MDKTDTINRWYDILHNLGIEVSYNTKEHTACPVCGKGNNSHRFRFDNLQGRGTWICTQCGAGDGFALVQKAKGVTFKEATKMIQEVLHKTVERVQNKSDDIPAIKRNIIKLYETSVPILENEIASKYLLSRAIFLKSVNDLRYCKQCYCKELGKNIPAMLGIVRNFSGVPIGFHRTYLNGPHKARLKEPKKLTKCLQKLSGCAIRLFNVKKMLGVAEGIETAISASIIYKTPVWSVISTKIMESFEPPEGVEKVVIYSDNDKNYAGQASAYKLAHRLSRDYDVDVVMPFLNDFNDVLIRGEL